MPDEITKEDIASKIFNSIGNFSGVTLSTFEIQKEINHAADALRTSGNKLGKFEEVRARWLAQSVDSDDLNKIKASFDKLGEVFQEARVSLGTHYSMVGKPAWLLDPGHRQWLA